MIQPTAKQWNNSRETTAKTAGNRDISEKGYRYNMNTKDTSNQIKPERNGKVIETGDYILIGDYMVSETQKYMLCKRNPKSNKPADYLIQIQPEEGYISSLYSEVYDSWTNTQEPASGVYRFDYSQDIYRLEIEREADLASIEKEGI